MKRAYARSRQDCLTIGLLCRQLTDEYSEAVWLGVDSAVRERGANLIYYAGGLPGEIDHASGSNVAYDLACVDMLDGVVIWGAQLSALLGPEGVRDLCDRLRSLPIVNIGLVLKGIPGLLVDNYQGMHDLVAHLIQTHGYSRIAFLHGPSATPEMLERYHGYTDALVEHGILPNDRLIVSEQERRHLERSEHVNYWEAGARILLDRRELRPRRDFEAVVGYNDLVAIGTLDFLRARGIDVPGDVAVVGFDDISRARYLSPPLTTVRQSFYELGQQAGYLLLERLAGAEIAERVLLPSRVIVRQSCGCPDPAIAQAAARPAGQHFEASVPGECVLAARRETILSEIEQLTNGSLEGLDPGWVGQLLDSFISEMAEPQGAFLSTLDSILRSMALEDGEAGIWQGVISVLRRQARPCLDGDTLYLAEDLWQQARVLIGQMAQRAEAYRAWHAEQRMQGLRELGQALSGAFDLEELMDILANGLIWLQMPSACISLYEDPTAPAEWSWLVMAYNERGRVELKPGTQRFRSSQLAPAGLLPQGRPYSLIVQPLYFHQEQFGFAVFEMGPRDRVVYDTVRAELGSALYATLQRAARGRAEVAPEQAPAEMERLALATDTRVKTGDLVIDLSTQSVRRGGVELDLTPREFGVLSYLIQHPGRVIGDDELLDAVWGSSAVIGDAALRTIVKQLRRKLGDDSKHPRHIITVWGRGYRFEL